MAVDKYSLLNMLDYVVFNVFVNISDININSAALESRTGFTRHSYVLNGS